MRDATVVVLKHHFLSIAKLTNEGSATRLLPSLPDGPLAFTEQRYCTVLAEDTPLSTKVAHVQAIHRQGLPVQYRISGGNRDGLFTIDRRTGSISLAAHLDYEQHERHLLEVSAETGSETARTSLYVLVADVNDNPPYFENFKTEITVIEEDDRNLPRVITKVTANDPDLIDEGSLEYFLEGEGVDKDNPGGPIFAIHSHTGEVLILRAVDRDPPHGRSVYKVKVRVKDGRRKERRERGEKEKSRDHDRRRERRNAASRNEAKLVRRKGASWEERRRLAANSETGGTVTEHVNKRNSHWKENVGESSRKTESISGEKRSRPQKHRTDNYYAGGSIKSRKKRFFCESFLPNKNQNVKFVNEGISKVLRRTSDGRSTSLKKDSNYQANRTDESSGKSWLTSKTSFTGRHDAESAVDLLKGEDFFHPNMGRKTTMKEAEKEVVEEEEEEEEEEFEDVFVDQERRKKNRIADNEQVIKEIREATRDKNKRMKSSNNFEHLNEGNAKNIKNRREKIKRIATKKINRQYKNLQTSRRSERGTGCKNKEEIELEKQNSFLSVEESVENWKFSLSIMENCRANNFKFALKSKEKVNSSQSQIYSRLKARTVFGRKERPNETFRLKGPSGYFRCFHIGNEKPEHYLLNPESCANLRKYYFEFSNIWFCLKKSILKFLKNLHESCACSTYSSLESFLQEHFLCSVLKSQFLPERIRYPQRNDTTVFLLENNEKKHSSRDGLLNVVVPSANRFPITKRIKNSYSHSELLSLVCNSPEYPFSLKISLYYDRKKNTYRNRFTRNEADIRSFTHQRTTPRMKAASSYRDPQNILVYSNLINESSQFSLINPKKIKISVQISNRGELPSKLYHRTKKSVFRSKFPVESLSKGSSSSGVTHQSKYISRRAREAHQTEGQALFSTQRKNFCVSLDSRIQIDQHGAGSSRRKADFESETVAPFMSFIFMVTDKRFDAETILTILVKDINDNAPVFPNTTMYGEVQENGPIDLPITRVTAWDSDDATSGTNARLTYSLEKNVIDEKSGEALFSIHPETGELRTALCCLDRETTPEYRIQVVASDGGGLKGSGTVIVRLADVNDNAPRLARDEWNIVVHETSTLDSLPNEVLAEISVTDPDTANYFLYRVLESSGLGWDHFSIRTKKGIGELYAVKALDYENELHRKGFRFQVQVTDRGPGGWSDPRHVDTAYINVTLRDVNDNAPQFERDVLHITVDEDVALDTVLAVLPATDVDQDSSGAIDYHLHDKWGSLKITPKGEVMVWKRLDRENGGEERNIVRVIAVDRGTPKLSATATLTITLRDVNDCPPRLLPPHILHVTENSPPKWIGELRATDDDIWSQGHGPPFQFNLDPSNPGHILDKINLKFDPSLDSGRGGATVWTLKPLDREEHRSITVNIELSDSQGLKASQPLTIVIDDTNDNKMKPGEKTVYLWRTRDAGSRASIGRVYVEDPDDWDLKDKSFEWLGNPHPLFSLDKDSGDLYASGQIREGRYHLFFGVSDPTWSQRSVRGNVTVIVRLLSQDALTHAVPLLLSPVSPSELTRNWNPFRGGGHLGALINAIKETIEERSGEVMVVSIYDLKEVSDSTSEAVKINLFFQLEMKITCIWVSFQEESRFFMNPIKLRGLLEMNIYKLREAAKLHVSLEYFGKKWQEMSSISNHFSSSLGSSPFATISSSSPHSPLVENSSTTPTLTDISYPPATSLAAIALPLQVVDNNSTSFVTPRLNRPLDCSSGLNSHFTKLSAECLPQFCLNGGKCASSERRSRCVCPGGTVEPFCKISTRGFSRGGWAWIEPLSPCMPSSVSLRVLTTTSSGVILYSGPLTPKPTKFWKPSSSKETTIQRYSGSEKLENYQFGQIEEDWLLWFEDDLTASGFDSTPNASALVSLYIEDGQPHFVLEGNGEPVHLFIESSQPLNDGEWHQINVISDEKKIVMMVDYCVPGWSGNVLTSSHCVDVHYWISPTDRPRLWGGTGPLQIGGLAHQPPQKEDHGWSTQPIGTSLEGCIADLRIGGELMDLGSPAYSYKSHPGCEAQRNACVPACEARSFCSGGLRDGAYCECPPGHTGPHCEKELEPVTFGKQSYAKVALSFVPDQLVLPIQVRVRSRQTKAALLHLTSQSRKETITLAIEGGRACLTFTAQVGRRTMHRPRRKRQQQQQPQKKKKKKKQKRSLERFLASRLNRHRRFVSLEPLLPMPPIWGSAVCVKDAPVSDGSWHTIRGGKFGHNLLLEVDDGDLGRRNESLIDGVAGDGGEGLRRPFRFKLDVREGISVGGIPHFQNGALKNVDNDLSEGCISDLRIYGKQVPLPLVLNETKWGQVTTFERIKTKCIAPDSCMTLKCKSPLVCRDEWRHGICRCPPGQQMTIRGCQEVDMCLLGPCLNGGSCVQEGAVMSCVCGPQHTGKHCEWDVAPKVQKQGFSPVFLISLISSSIFLALFLMAFGVKFYSSFKKRKHKRKDETNKETSSEEKEGEQMEIFYIYDQKEKKGKRKKRLEIPLETIRVPTAENPEAKRESYLGLGCENERRSMVLGDTRVVSSGHTGHFRGCGYEEGSSEETTRQPVVLFHERETVESGRQRREQPSSGD